MCKKGLPLPLEHREAIALGVKWYYAIHGMSQERKDAISRGIRKYRATHKVSQSHKDAISYGMKKYYLTHDAPWKGIKRSGNFKDNVSETLKRTYENGHTNWNRGLKWPQEIRQKIREGCLNSSIGMVLRYS